jgi:hypothetical protein
VPDVPTGDRMPDDGLFVAQLNVAQALYELDDPRMASYLSLIEEVNAAADRAAGFVWRLKDGSGKLNVGRSSREIVNLSVWRSLDDLRDFVHGEIHGHALRKRSKWFIRLPSPYSVVWSIPLGRLPTLQEGLKRLAAPQHE